MKYYIVSFFFTKLFRTEINKLLDNDKNINQELFRKQFIKEFENNNVHLDLMLEPDIEKVYQELRRILIEKNNLIDKTNTLNTEVNYGISPDKLLTQFEIEETIQKKMMQLIKNQTLKQNYKTQ